MKKKKIIITGLAIILLAILVTGGIFIYNQKTKEAFGAKFNAMNEAYKKVLFATGQNRTESQSLMTDYEIAWNSFYKNYRTNPIAPYDSDAEWQISLDNMNAIVRSSKILVVENKLKDAHLELEKIRGLWQELFQRNKVTMLGFYLTEYHDVMEKAISQADAKDYEGLKTTCSSLRATWDDVKSTEVSFTEADLEDYNIKVAAVSENLQKLCNAAETKDEASVKDAASKLKPTFIPLYLKFG